MQFNQPYFGIGFNNGAPFSPMNTSFQTQCVPSPEVVGEGEVVSLVLPDGSVQLFFLPTNKWCAPFITIPNKSSCWFIKSVANPVPHPTFFQNQLPGGVPYPRLTLGYSGSFEVPNPFKFHSDGATSTTDIHYFYPRLCKFANTTKLCTGVQVMIPGQSSSCQSEGVSCIPSHCGQHTCNCCNRKCDNKGETNSNREVSSQGDTKTHNREDFICKCHAEPKVKRSSHSQTCMSIDEPRLKKKREKEKKQHSEPKKKRSTHSQTSMSVDESISEIGTSRSKKQKSDRIKKTHEQKCDRRKTNERRRIKSKHTASGECSCTSIRKRKGKKKNRTRKKKKMNRTSNTSDTSLSSSKSTTKQFTRDQYFDNRVVNKDRHSNSVSSELECQFCESCLSSLELKMNLHQKNKSSTEVTCKCYSSTEFLSSVSQTDTSHGMSVDQEIKGNRKKHSKSEVEKKNQDNTATRDGMMIDQEIKPHENINQSNKKQIDNTSVTCVCIYPGSKESPIKNTQHNEPSRPVDKDISKHSSKPLNLRGKTAQLRHNKASNTGPIYKADAEFCECFSDLIQPPTRDKTFKEIEKALKKSEKANSSKRKVKEKPLASCKCSETLDLVDIATQDDKIVDKNENPMAMEKKDNIDSRPSAAFNTTPAVHSREMENEFIDTCEQLCNCETPKPNLSPPDIAYSAYFSHSSIVDSNSLFHYDRTPPVHFRASCIVDTTKDTPIIPKSNSV